MILLQISMHLYFKVLVYLFLFTLIYGSTSSSQNGKLSSYLCVMKMIWGYVVEVVEGVECLQGILPLK